MRDQSGRQFNFSAQAARDFREQRALLREAVAPKLSFSQFLELLLDAWRRAPLSVGEIERFDFSTKHGRPRS